MPEDEKYVWLKVHGNWQPGRCIVPFDIEQSCPLSRTGCWVNKEENCPLNKSTKEEGHDVHQKGDTGNGGPAGC